MSDLAKTYLNQGNLIDAEKLHGFVLDVRTKVLGEEHPDTLQSKVDIEGLRNPRQGTAQTEPYVREETHNGGEPERTNPPGNQHQDQAPTPPQPDNTNPSGSEHNKAPTTPPPPPSPGDRNDPFESEYTDDAVFPGSFTQTSEYFREAHHFVMPNARFTDISVSVQIHGGEGYFLAAGLFGWVLKTGMSMEAPPLPQSAATIEIKVEIKNGDSSQTYTAIMPARPDGHHHIEIDIPKEGGMSLKTSQFFEMQDVYRVAEVLGSSGNARNESTDKAETVLVIHAVLTEVEEVDVSVVLGALGDNPFYNSYAMQCIYVVLPKYVH
ncbi:hypothetical protein BDQ17DRAFT_1328193 [Cyathus striatus]|nr:hypothetical protein BDQ17DRAFT_1328193 [Cyathus striatus]